MDMRKLFPGYYELTDEQLTKIWEECTFVFDTNILLHIYRYKPETRKRFFYEILERLGTRIWIPYQVAHEFQKQRLAVIDDQAKAYDQVIDLLGKISSDLKKALNKYNERHTFINPSQFNSKIEHAITESKQILYEAKKQHPNLWEVDTFRDKIDELFGGKIGNPYDEAVLKEKYQEAERRFELNIPPGPEDAGKKSITRYGDVILWFQLLDFVTAEKKPIIFITDDVKEDWWLSPTQSHSPIRPHPELVQEMYLKAGVSFHMYEGYKFVEKAQTFLQLENQPAIIDEIKAVGQLTSQREEIQTTVEMFEAVKTSDIRAWIEQMGAMNVTNVGAMFNRILEEAIIPETQTMIDPIAEKKITDMQAIFKKLEFLNFSDMRELFEKIESLGIPNIRAVFETLSLPSTRAKLETINLPNINLPNIQDALEAFDTPMMKATFKASNIPDIQTMLETAIILSNLSPSAEAIEANDQNELNNKEEDNTNSQ